MATLRDKLRGCLVGAAVDDVVGAVVDAESPRYISKKFGRSMTFWPRGSVEEFSGPARQVGRFTDDTRMTLCVAEWLIAGDTDSPIACWRASPTPPAVAALRPRDAAGIRSVADRLYEKHAGGWAARV